MKNKNHEGYNDPTVSEAIERASKRKKKKSGQNWKRLTYKLAEVQGFKKFME